MGDHFRGWYLKCQNGTDTVALIPALHRGKGERAASIQLITSSGAWNIPIPMERVRFLPEGIQMENSRFSKHGIHLNLLGEGLEAAGELTFGSFTPLKYDIMGPFRYVPFLECRHSVFSMRHRVNGCLVINGRRISFMDGTGYIEGDRGYSFPKHYVWSQCCFPQGSVMVSAAQIPFCGMHFTGVICAVFYQGREYRLATYLGAKAVRIRDGEVVIRQGKNTLTIRCLEGTSHPLAAPVLGNMQRTIHESAACRVRYQFEKNGKTIFDLDSSQAAFEYEYPI